jgi:hypothetical protein
MGCPPLKSVTEGDVLSVRGSNYALVDMAYDFVPIPLNFLDTPGVEYCFESYQGYTTDFGLAKTYERDVWNGAETNHERSGAGWGVSGGGVTSSAYAFNSSDSNYCNRANNRMPTVNNCAGSRMQYDWYGDRDVDLPKWYKDDGKPDLGLDSVTLEETTDKSKLLKTAASGYTSAKDSATPYPYGYKKWFFCGGNGAYSRLNLNNTTDTEDYQVRLRPGYRGSISGTYISNAYRINNRSFKAYARIPGSRALYRQAFTMTVRGTTYVYEYGWPIY